MTKSFYLQIIHNDGKAFVVHLGAATPAQSQEIYEDLRARLEEARGVNAPLLSYVVASEELTLDPATVVDLLLREED